MTLKFHDLSEEFCDSEHVASILHFRHVLDPFTQRLRRSRLCLHFLRFSKSRVPVFRRQFYCHLKLLLSRCHRCRQIVSKTLHSIFKSFKTYLFLVFLRFCLLKIEDSLKQFGIQVFNGSELACFVHFIDCEAVEAEEVAVIHAEQLANGAFVTWLVTLLHFTLMETQQKIKNY